MTSIELKLNTDALIDRLHVVYKDIDLIATVASIALGRSVDPNDVRNRLQKVSTYQRRLQSLLDIPKMEQRTPAWYEARTTMITASDFAQALGKGKFGTQKQFFQKKCGYEKDSFDMFKAALCWGVMFEPVAAEAYAFFNKCKLFEFGLLRHPEIKWVGASPDGINENGVMLEIKCPFKRKITGDVPTQYYYQMQGQLDVCGLDECDYLECEFLEYDNETEFVRHFADNIYPKGIVVELVRPCNITNSKYIYSPFDLHADRVGTLEWLRIEQQRITPTDIAKIHYWQLWTYSVIRIYKDEEFLQRDVYPELKHVWEKVVAYKLDRALYEQEVTCATSNKNKDVATKTNNDEMPKLSINISTATKNVKFDAYAFIEEDP
jgi:putative phage-type endonuclease